MRVDLSNTDLIRIVASALSDPGILDDIGDYYEFMQGITHVVAEHFGGHVINNRTMDLDYMSEDDLSVGVELDSSVPPDGGIYGLCAEGYNEE